MERYKIYQCMDDKSMYILYDEEEKLVKCHDNIQVCEYWKKVLTFKQ